MWRALPLGWFEAVIERTIVHIVGTKLLLELAGGTWGTFRGLSPVWNREMVFLTLGAAALDGVDIVELVAGSRALEDDILSLLLSFLFFSKLFLTS